MAKINKAPVAVLFGVARWPRQLLFFALFLPGLISCGFLPSVVSGPDPTAYQARLAAGWKYLNKRQHSRALEEFAAAQTLRPNQAEPRHGRTRALFNLARFSEVLGECAELSGDSAEYYDALGFCWAARLEIGRAAPAIKSEVRREIERLLAGNPAPPLALLNAASSAYYYLKDSAKRSALLVRLAEEGADSDRGADIAGDLFEEIIVTEAGSERRLELADLYLRRFPEGVMADKVAALVLAHILARQKDKPDYWQIAQTVLAGRASTLLNGAVALWLIEQGTDYEHAIDLLHKNLEGFAGYRQKVPAHFSQALWQREADKKYFFYKYLLGRAWLGKGELLKARELFTEVLAKQPDWAGVDHFLGIIAIRDGRSEQAIEYLRSALAKGTTRPETSKELQILLKERSGFTGEPLAYFQAREGGVRFRDVTEVAGLSGVKAWRVAWGDYDNDGDDDLLLDGARLFNNQANHVFREMEQMVPGGITGTNGGIWGDYDNDGFLDIFATSHHGNYLLHNEAGLGFSRSDILPLPPGLASTEAVAWGDLNNDGYLDLYVANYEQGTVMRGQCGQDQLLVNQGGRGFKELGAEGGVGSEEAMCGRGVTWSDLNNDGWQEIIVANYRLDPNFLWLNRGDGLVQDIAEAAGVQGQEVGGAYGHSIGSVSGDLDGDGDFDLFTSNLAHPRYIEFSDQSMVLLNNGEKVPEFTDRFAESGIAFAETSADPLFFDVDYDGDLDLFITSVYRQSSAHLYLNDGKGGFRDQTWLAGAGVNNGWGAAAADYDGDGYLDLLVAGPDGVRLLHNEGSGHNWLAVRVDDRNCNRFGVGSKVVVDYGQQRQVREITAGRGTGSQDTLTTFFGLGAYSGAVSIQVKTLCGEVLSGQTKELNRMVLLGNKGPQE